MRILAVLAHPRSDATVSTMFYRAVAQLQAQGAQVDVLDLYAHADKIPFFQLHAPGKTADETFAAYPFYAENKARVLAADRLLIAYPVWWYAVPGIMKAWLDLITGYAWQFKGGNHAQARHKITKALVINTADMSWWYRLFGTRNSATEMVKESCKFLSIPGFKAYEINSARSMTEPQRAQHQARINRHCSWLIAE